MQFFAKGQTMLEASNTSAPDSASPLLSDYVDKPGIAGELRCTPRTVDRLSLYEGLPYVQVGGKRLFRRSAVLEWLRERETPKGKRGAR